mmetsp:Transcript_62127/g.173535  ORF Transcript_62127/g.173535 Transcript_62127/m.173535 type:complete len:353 (+) Transcript_62127:147-1205(+)
MLPNKRHTAAQRQTLRPTKKVTRTNARSPQEAMLATTFTQPTTAQSMAASTTATITRKPTLALRTSSASTPSSFAWPSLSALSQAALKRAAIATESVRNLSAKRRQLRPTVYAAAKSSNMSSASRSNQDGNAQSSASQVPKKWQARASGNNNQSKSSNTGRTTITHLRPYSSTTKASSPCVSVLNTLWAASRCSGGRSPTVVSSSSILFRSTTGMSAKAATIGSGFSRAWSMASSCAACSTALVSLAGTPCCRTIWSACCTFRCNGFDGCTPRNTGSAVRKSTDASRISPWPSSVTPATSFRAKACRSPSGTRPYAFARLTSSVAPGSDPSSLAARACSSTRRARDTLSLSK